MNNKVNVTLILLALFALVMIVAVLYASMFFPVLVLALFVYGKPWLLLIPFLLLIPLPLVALVKAPKAVKRYLIGVARKAILRKNSTSNRIVLIRSVPVSTGDISAKSNWN